MTEMTEKQKQKVMTKAIYQLGMMRLMELAREAGQSQIDIYLPGLDDYLDYTIAITESGATVAATDQWEQLTIVGQIEL